MKVFALILALMAAVTALPAGKYHDSGDFDYAIERFGFGYNMELQGSVVYSTDDSGDYSSDYSGGYSSDYFSDYSGDYSGGYSGDFSGDYSGDFLGSGEIDTETGPESDLYNY